METVLDVDNKIHISHLRRNVHKSISITTTRTQTLQSEFVAFRNVEFQKV